MTAAAYDFAYFSLILPYFALKCAENMKKTNFYLVDKSSFLFGAERGILAFSSAPRSDVINVILCRQFYRNPTTVRQSVLLPQNGSHPRIPLNSHKQKNMGITTVIPIFLARREGFEPPEALTSTVFKKLTAFPISSLTLPNRVGFYPKNRPFLHVFCIFARNLREKCEKTLPPD